MYSWQPARKIISVMTKVDGSLLEPQLFLLKQLYTKGNAKRLKVNLILDGFLFFVITISFLNCNLKRLLPILTSREIGASQCEKHSLCRLLWVEGRDGVSLLEFVTFFKASVRLKTRAVILLIIYSQKILYEECAFKGRLVENKTATCEYLWQPIICSLPDNAPLLSSKINL